MIESMCRSWYAAERLSSEASYEGLSQEQRDEVRRRVVLVLSGEVRYSECSPGDLRIWTGRARDRDWWEQVARRQFRDEQTRGFRELAWANYWDTLGWMPNWPIQSGTRLFGNANVGAYDLCNLQVAGQMCSDKVFYARSWYAKVPFDIDVIDEVNVLLMYTIIDFTIGDRMVLKNRLVDLVDGLCDANFLIPVRQNFSAIVTISCSSALRSLNEKLAVRHRAVPGHPNWGIAIHLEGAESRSVT